MSFRFTRMLVLAVGLSVAAAACGQYSISNLRAMKAFKEANELYKRGDYKSAAERYEQAAQFSPDFGLTYFFLGNSYDNLYKPTRKGEPENDQYLQKAVANYRIAIEKLTGNTDPKEAEFRKLSYEFLIAAYGTDKLNDLSQAEPIAKQLIALEPDESANYTALARLYQDAGRYDEAEEQYKKAIEVRPSADNYANLAGFYNSQGLFDKTMEAWQQRANVEPNNPEAWHTMATYFAEKTWKDTGLSKAEQRDYAQKGLDAEEKALALNPDYFEAVTYKNILLRLLAKVEPNRAKQEALIKEADQVQARALELQKKQNKTGGGGL